MTAEQSKTSSSDETIVDAHVHLYSKRLARAIRSFFEQHISTELAYPINPAAIIKSHRNAGVDYAWNLPYAHRPGISRNLNEDTASISTDLSRSGLKVVSGCTVHPADSRAPEIIIRASESSGAKVLKLHCSVGGYRIDDPRLDDVWSTAAELAMPVVVHVGVAVNGTTAIRDLDALRLVLGRYPEVDVVLAHLGWPNRDVAIGLMETHPNLYGDLTPVVSSEIQLPSDGVPNSIMRRLLFGSDAPNSAIHIARLLDSAREGFRWPDFKKVVGLNALSLM